MLLQQTVFREVGSVATSSKNDWTIGLLVLPLVLVLNTDNLAALLDQFEDACLLKDLDAVGNRDGEVLEALELSVGNDLKGIGQLKIT